jgi:uncharacterized protein
VIDCDLHASVPSLQILVGFMEPLWTEWTRYCSSRGPAPWRAALSAQRAHDGSCRMATCGRTRASFRDVDAAQARGRALGTERAIVNCYHAVDSIRHPDVAAALASAINDWR